MTLEDFEQSLAEAKREAKAERHHRRHRDDSHRHHDRHHRDSKSDDGHRHKRRRHSPDDDEQRSHSRRERRREETSHSSRRDNEKDAKALDQSEELSDDAQPASRPDRQDISSLKRDSWMEAPPSDQVKHVHRPAATEIQPVITRSSRAEHELKVHANELNKHHLKQQEAAAGSDQQEPTLSSGDDGAAHRIDYTIGDEGSKWRMTRLRGVFQRAKESGRPVEMLALEQYGSLRSFDDAREEEIELDRSERYGKGYVGKEKPSGELFDKRQLQADSHNGPNKAVRERSSPRDSRAGSPEIVTKDTSEQPPRSTLDETSLNKLKAQMMRAKLRKAPNAAELESAYNAAAGAFVPNQKSSDIVLSAVETRLFAGGRQGEVKAVDTKRGRERGTVEENEDMSIEDMVREERRTRGQAGGESRRYAERIAKDSRYSNDLDYMDDNASKLAKRVHRSEINLKTMAVNEYQKINRILDACPLCYHEDTSTPPLAPIVALGTRVYMTLAPEPVVTKGSACIVPIQHRKNLLECDDDEWEEIRNFMKALTRTYHARHQVALFHEDASRPQAHRHAVLRVTPLPASAFGTAPAFFREALLAAAPTWARHRPLIDTQAAATEKGMGRNAFRRSLAREMPYFHVWFTLDGGLGHIVEEDEDDGPEDEDDGYGGGGRGRLGRHRSKWPRGDGFAREVLAGIMGVESIHVRQEGRWGDGGREAGREWIERWKKRWDWARYDWTTALVEDQG